MNELSFNSGLVIFLVGIMTGSFVNVVIHRLPRMVMNEQTTLSGSVYDLSQPASHCPHCHTPLRIWHNIPLVSFLFLKGHCGFCQHPIGTIYPAVEALTGLLWLGCAWHWGINTNALCWAWFGTSLLALSVIDWQTTLLPDGLTQSLLWAGLMASAMRWVELPLEHAVWGSVAGYVSLWTVAFTFERVTHKEGMGAGDFKLLAAMGAWLGPLALIPLVLLASVSGVIIGLILKFKGHLGEGGYLPFGPFLALSASIIAVCGADQIMRIMRW